jgi:hypothetical protein
MPVFAITNDKPANISWSPVIIMEVDSCSSIQLEMLIIIKRLIPDNQFKIQLPERPRFSQAHKSNTELKLCRQEHLIKIGT